MGFVDTLGPGQLAGNSERARWFLFLFYILIYIYFFKYETIVSRNGLSLGYSEQDTGSVSHLLWPKIVIENHTHTPAGHRKSHTHMFSSHFSLNKTSFQFCGKKPL